MHTDMVSAVLGYRPVSSRLISIRLRAALFNISIIQVYAPTSGHDESGADHLYQQTRKPYINHQRRIFWLYKADWNAKVGRMRRQAGETFVGPSAMSRKTREVSDF